VPREDILLLTYKFRIKDGGSKSHHLKRWANAVNTVWNYCNEASYNQLKKYSKWLNYYDLNNLTKGSSKELNLNSATIQQICKEYTTKRYQFKKQKLNWRTSKGSRRSLGWIPCTNQNIKLNKDAFFTFSGKTFKFWKTREIPKDIRTISLNEDSRGHWYINFAVEVDFKKQTGNSEIGIDLGLSTNATLSDGRKYNRENITKYYEKQLAMAQRANKKHQVTKIYAKIKNIRKDWNHKTANNILKDSKLVIVGDVSSSKLTKTKMAKSVLDAGWSQLRSMLAYKAIKLGIEFKEVNESWTSRTCNVCGEIGEHQGLSGLSVRQWECKSCHTLHDRDVNAAINILNVGLGHKTLIKGIPRL
jgi:IS605 OrfB family transposase